MRRFIARPRFTLIEMMMVLVIVMAMSAFSVGLYSYTRDIMAETRTRTLIVRLDTAFRKLYEKYGEYPKSVEEGTLLFPDISDDLDKEEDLIKKLRDENYSCLKGLPDDYIKDFINELDLPNLLRENGEEILSGDFNDYYCLLDGWARPIYYSSPGKWNTQSFDLCSAGADGNAFNIKLTGTSTKTESEWQEEWAKKDNQLADIWDMEKYTLSSDAKDANPDLSSPSTSSDGRELHFSPVYGDDITNF